MVPSPRRGDRREGDIRAQDRFPEFLDDQREFFDELITKEWDTYVAVRDARVRRCKFEVDQMLRHSRSVRTALDVGCGQGDHDVELASRHGVRRVDAIDYSPRSVEVADREHPHESVRRWADDIFRMPSGEYDLVFAICVLPHLRNPVEFLEACGQQLAPGGRIVVTTPNRDRLENRLRRLVGKPDALIDPQHYSEYVPADMERFGRRAGLRLVATFAYDFHVNTPWFSFMPPGDLQVGRRLPAIASRFGAVFREG